MRLAVIPARGGSKRIPRKNIKEFCGKPMIAWSIEAVIESGCFNRIIVSTDDDEIAKVALKYGADVPFVRPQELSGDEVGTLPVIKHAIEWQNENGLSVNQACCVYATAPFLMAKDIQIGFDKLINSGASYAFSVTSYAFPIQRAISITEGGRIQMFQPEHLNSRSQDLEEAWHDAGQFYWGKAQAWLESKKVFSEQAVPVKLPRHRVQDIDTQEDWMYAELMFELISSQEKEL